MKKIYTIFGGNFDPIHYGHICTAINIAKEILVKKIILLPNHNPPHRQKTKTSITDKLKMIKLITNHYKLFKVSYLETQENKTFYTIDTLKKIRMKIGNTCSLCFILGEDNLQTFDTWKDWKKILSYTHLLICPRKHKKNNNSKLKEWIISKTTKNFYLLHQKSSGYIFFLHTPIIHISSTNIRNNYYIGKNSFGLVPYIIEKYISSNKLYKKI